MNSLEEKEKEVKVSRLRHTILENELKILRKEEELKRLKEENEKYKLKLNEEL